MKGSGKDVPEKINPLPVVAPPEGENAKQNNTDPLSAIFADKGAILFII